MICRIPSPAHPALTGQHQPQIFDAPPGQSHWRQRITLRIPPTPRVTRTDSELLRELLERMLRLHPERRTLGGVPERIRPLLRRALEIHPDRLEQFLLELRSTSDIDRQIPARIRKLQRP